MVSTAGGGAAMMTKVPFPPSPEVSKLVLCRLETWKLRLAVWEAVFETCSRPFEALKLAAAPAELKVLRSIVSVELKFCSCGPA